MLWYRFDTLSLQNTQNCLWQRTKRITHRFCFLCSNFPSRGGCRGRRNKKGMEDCQVTSWKIHFQATGISWIHHSKQTLASLNCATKLKKKFQVIVLKDLPIGVSYRPPCLYIYSITQILMNKDKERHSTVAQQSVITKHFVLRFVDRMVGHWTLGTCPT